MPMTSRRWRILPSARHDSVDHSWFQVAQINEQGVQLLQKINEFGIVRIIDVQIMPGKNESTEPLLPARGPLHITPTGDNSG
jgi:hypothetical protein